jgi:hypothetical protein
MPPSGRRTIRAESPNFSDKYSRCSSGISRLSPYQKIERPEGVIRKYEGSISSREDITDNSPSFDNPCITPDSRARVPSFPANKARTGVDSAISLLMRANASWDEIMFLLIAKEYGVYKALSVAKMLDFSYIRPLAAINPWLLLRE